MDCNIKLMSVPTDMKVPTFKKISSLLEIQCRPKLNTSELKQITC